MESNSAKHMKVRIVDVFIDLLRTHALAHITVNDICARAEIGRSTFYRYYNDVYGVVEDFILHIHYEAETLSKGHSRHDAIVAAFDCMEKYRVPLKNVATSETDVYVYPMMMKFYAEAIYEELVAQEQLGRRFSVSLDFLADFFSAGLCHVQMKWIRGENKYDKQGLIDDITQLLLRAGLSDHA